MKRKDLLTGEEFTPKRITQNFIDDKNRIIYHNQKATKERHENAKIDKHQKINKRIFDQLMRGKTKQSLKLDILIGMGFHPSIFNRLQVIENKQYFGLYKFLFTVDRAAGTITIFIDDRY